MTSFKRTQRKYVQKTYRVRNWTEYETGLRAWQPDARRVEARLACSILNRMLELGAARSCSIGG